MKINMNTIEKFFINYDKKLVFFIGFIFGGIIVKILFFLINFFN